jgi:hypothetical protein
VAAAEDRVLGLRELRVAERLDGDRDRGVLVTFLSAEDMVPQIGQKRKRASWSPILI